MISIDTLYIQTKGVVPEQQLRNIARHGKWHTWHHDGTGTNGYDCYKHVVDNVAIKYTRENSKLAVEIGSCGHFLHGNSMVPIQDVEAVAFIEKLEQFLYEHTRVELFAPLANAQIRRLDVKRDFRVGDDLADYLAVLKEHQIPTYEKNIFGDGNTIQFKNHSRKMMGYNRYANCVGKKKSVEETEMSRGVLRFETVCSQAELSRQLNEVVPTLGDVFTPDATDMLLERYLGMLGLNDTVINTEAETLRLLEASIGKVKARNIMFYLHAKREGKWKEFSRTARYSYEKTLDRLGIASVIGTKTLKPLKEYSFIT
ncbi:hypothetical protein [Paenibacillus ihuae]|uniref:hypothetical protein n=1 Tax=Paenibacillus ihuae TaxID=1232431 RepID=UPI0006D54CE3|nr:hypothetical protein [Paenibacillus ihuae]